MRFRRTILGSAALAMTFGVGLSGTQRASAGVAFGNCPVNGYYCSWQYSPRTADNISSNVAIIQHSAYSYPFSGSNWNDRNKDNANLSGGTFEICNNTGYSGGGFTLAPGIGMVRTTPAASSSRNLINSCNN